LQFQHFLKEEEGGDIEDEIPALDESGNSEGAITLSLKNGPEFRVPKTLNGPEGTVGFESVEVEEHFTIYLHNETTSQNIKQWEWSYAYKVDSQ
jgi:hypothetical protein